MSRGGVSVSETHLATFQDAFPAFQDRRFFQCLSVAIFSAQSGHCGEPFAVHDVCYWSAALSRLAFSWLGGVAKGPVI